MTSRGIGVAAFVVLIASTPPADLAGQASASARERQSLSSGATAILVDVVVRDRKNLPVTDLAAADFEIYEDGVRQNLDTFTRISRGSGIGVGIAWKSADRTVAVNPTGLPAGAPAADAPEEEEETTTAVVFDHLSSETLRVAQQATLQYIPESGESRGRIGVFATDAGVRVVQRYTNDLPRVRQAIEAVIPSGTAAEEAKADRNDQLTARRRELRDTLESAAAGVVAGGGAVVAANSAELGRRETELRMIQMELNMARSFDNLDRDHKGYDTALGLLAVVQSLSTYPGRKTIVFFSEGLPVSPVLSARLDFVIDIANRSNVTAYVIDANGLRVKSAATNMQKEMQAFADERLAQIASGSDRTEQPLTMAFERVEDTLKLDSRTGLARLAGETGGFLIEQTNNLSSAFRRIEEDSRFHYLLTYSPANPEFDGKFREIRVKVRRPGTQVFARKGYRALRAPGAIDAGSYERPALALLDRTSLPNVFPVHAAGFTFPDPARPGLTPVIVQVRTDALRFTIDQRRGTYSAQAAVVVRIRDEHGDEAQKLSQQYLLAGEAKDVDAARNGEILFYRETNLAPGVYTMEAIVFDAIAQQGSARVATLSVPRPGAAMIGMSSLVLINRIEDVSDVPAEAAAAAPLYVGRSLLYPLIGEPIRRSETSELPFYFALYGRVQGLEASAQLLQNGKVLAEAPVQLPQSNGPRVQHVGRLPIGALPPGTYELRIRVTDGKREESRTAYFTLRD
jgi:VWFA-related protein